MVETMQQGLRSKVSQRLALTPQLTQSLKVLAMNNQELALYIEGMLQSNPLLELEPALLPKDTPSPAKQEIDWRDLDTNDWDATYYCGSQSDSLSNLERQWHQEQSLSASLHQQIDQQPMANKTRLIAHAIIDSLEDDGYFYAEAANDIVKVMAVDDIQVADVYDVLTTIVQELEPAGIGAQDLVGCLLLQINDEDPSAMLARQILLHHRDDLTDDTRLLAVLGCDADALVVARALLRRLDPYPGHDLRGVEPIDVQPEVIFRMVNQQVEIEVPKSGWHGLTLSRRWEGECWSDKDRLFMLAAKQEATGLLHALGRRSETLMKVAVCLAEKQRLFLEHGVLGLKPLTLHEVAEELGLHASTISRVTYGKYAETPLGLVEMRIFFSAGLPTRGGGMVSVHRVQQRVKILIGAESGDSPVSDQAITDRLQAEGIEITRRTVAKYRKQLGLQTSSQRKRAAKGRLFQSRGK